MNLAATIAIGAGGVGSGCHGENCGRPHSAIPTLTELAREVKQDYIQQHRYKNTGEVLYGRCDQCAETLARMIGGEYKRGWYKGKIDNFDYEKLHRQRENAGQLRAAHSWVVKDGKIYDPTWWTFTDSKPRMAVFSADDPRYEEDSEAE